MFFVSLSILCEHGVMMDKRLPTISDILPLRHLRSKGKDSHYSFDILEENILLSF